MLTTTRKEPEEWQEKVKTSTKEKMEDGKDDTFRPMITPARRSTAMCMQDRIMRSSKNSIPVK